MSLFYRQRVQDKTTSQVFIISLAVVDLITCLVIIPFTIVFEYLDSKVLNDVVCKVYQFLMTSKIPLSSILMVAIAFERYFCICHPHKRIINHRRARIAIAISSIISCFYGICIASYYSVYQYFEVWDVNQTDELFGTNYSYQLQISNATHKEQIRAEILTAYKNASNKDPYDSVIVETWYTGYCDILKSKENDSTSFIYHFKWFYHGVYPFCLIIVIILYTAIFQFLYKRRENKLQQRLVMCSYIHDDTHNQSKPVDSTMLCESVKPTADSPLDRKPPLDNNKGNNSTIPTKIDVVISGEPAGDTTSEAPCSNSNGLLKVEVDESQFSCSPSGTSTSYLGGVDVEVNKEDANGGPGCHAPSKEVNNSSVKRCNKANSEKVACEKKKEEKVESPSTDDGEFDQSSIRRHSHYPEQKYQWHKNRDSVKRFKGRARSPQYTAGEAEAGRLRDENRIANAKTALMLFIVALVFVLAFAPSYLMIYRWIPYNKIVFYLHFMYNVANPFIYTFMNHIFQKYIRNVFTCRDVNEIRWS